MTYNRPVADELDIYGCNNPDCRFRLRTIKAGSIPPRHCGIRTTYIATLARSKWRKIVSDNAEAVRAIQARIAVSQLQTPNFKLPTSSLPTPSSQLQTSSI